MCWRFAPAVVAGAVVRPALLRVRRPAAAAGRAGAIAYIDVTAIASATITAGAGGAAGAAAAILLARAGVAVDLVEATSDVGSTGSGITLQGNALRVFRELGVLDAILAHGYAFDEVGLRAPDGTVLAVIPDAKTGGEDLPATVGMPRAVRRRLLQAA